MAGEALIGSTVSHYRINRKLGSGGMGVVFEAEDTSLGRRVALKFLSDGLQQDAPMLERFQREARAASALNHPGICTVHAIEQHEGRSFIVMELLEGEPLSARIGAQSMEIGALLDIAIQIADALESAHSKGIVHRDLKPANIFVTPRGQVKILDFGLAKIDHNHAAGDETFTESAAAHAGGGDLTVAGTVLGSVHYMSPEQARGQLTDPRTDLFSFGAVLYQMATGVQAFEGDTQAMVFDSILNRAPRPAAELNPALPPGLVQIVAKTLEKDRNLRCQSATEVKTDLLRLKRDTESSERRSTELADSKSRAGAAASSRHSVAVLYFQNLSGAKEDEYLRDGITEDIITELSKIESLETFSRSTVLGYRDKPAAAAEIGRRTGATYVLEGSLRRAGDRLRINAQLVDPRTDHPVWSERYDREMKDIFDVQDEIARKIAEALRIKLSPREQEAIAAKPTQSLKAYELYLKGKNYARRLTRQDSEFALQMYDNAVAEDPGFALAYAAIANVCAMSHANFDRSEAWLDRARAAAEKAAALSPDLPEAGVAQGWILAGRGQYQEACDIVRAVIARQRDTDGAYYLLLRALFLAGDYAAVAGIADEALEAAGSDYNVYVPIMNALNALGKTEAARNVGLRRLQVLENHLRDVPEDARARILLASGYSKEGRTDDAMREANLAMTLRPNDSTILYNAACTFCRMGQKAEALDALAKAWRGGFRDSDWTRRDPDLALLHGDPEFERLYPEKKAGA